VNSPRPHRQRGERRENERSAGHSQADLDVVRPAHDGPDDDDRAEPEE
jgi:hypothetical protein